MMNWELKAGSRVHLRNDVNDCEEVIVLDSIRNIDYVMRNKKYICKVEGI